MRRNHVNAKAAKTAKEESFEKMLCALCDLCVQRDSFTSSEGDGLGLPGKQRLDRAAETGKDHRLELLVRTNAQRALVSAVRMRVAIDMFLVRIEQPVLGHAEACKGRFLPSKIVAPRAR